jgi:hypothetical protein
LPLDRVIERKSGSGGRWAQLATQVIHTLKTVDGEFIDENDGGPGVRLGEVNKQKR